MTDINIKTDVLPVVTAGEEVVKEALSLINNFSSGDQQQKRAIVRALKKANKAIVYANKAFKISDKSVTDKKYLKYRKKFEELD